ncbi:hypothetical protein DLR60_17955 [Vibrio tarriae]|uniref:hypothetical protein n=1 Tax=Vibrio tarriae TaxID=2014742 RepID=UPI000DE1D46A|nr:hypothetical protein [Vibrio tarriae]RBM25214.1 hypothetical protein DLR59_16425 [Vibrio tarriae]RBM26131.1 hypothetical protein DLR61_17165 [Vibrio tarriae]RBM35821.1 hypothetical protein DLR63_15335 [Vibrio tarriae]RBM47272.1 hypothetical protein DLR64_16425 [Vibrio tarriae]RBM50462.1 hypothetical protein DLR65_06760 [Vibrio tarriae]
MNRFLITLLSLITGVFALIFSLLLAIPLTIAALITGKRLEKQLKARAYQFHQQATYTTHSNVIEGEYEEISPRR